MRSLYIIPFVLVLALVGYIFLSLELNVSEPGRGSVVAWFVIVALILFVTAFLRMSVGGARFKVRITDGYEELANPLVSAVNRLIKAAMVFQIAERMIVGKPEDAILRIAAPDTNSLLAAQYGLDEAETRVAMIGAVMKARLQGEGMVVRRLSSDKQVIPPHGFAEWKWRVTLTSPGEKTVWLHVTVVLASNGTTAHHDLPPWEKQILVEGDLQQAVLAFWLKHWQWIIGLLLGSGLVTYALDKFVFNTKP